MTLLRLFSDRSHYHREQRWDLSDVLRPYWKDAPFSDEQRQEMYGLSANDLCLVDHLSEADIAVLPMSWNFYLGRGDLARAVSFIQAARRAGRPVLSYVYGDEGVTVPAAFDDVYVARASGFRSRRLKRQLAQPVFFEDPLTKYPEFQKSLHSQPSTPDPTLNPQLPTIGFCGQASLNPLKLIADILRALCRNAAYHLKSRLQEPQPIYPPALLRARALRLLAGSPQVQTKFILRSHYRAGAFDAAARERTSRDFYANISQTDYTLCVRPMARVS